MRLRRTSSPLRSAERVARSTPCSLRTEYNGPPIGRRMAGRSSSRVGTLGTKTSGPCQSLDRMSRTRWSRHQRMKERDASRPTGDGWRITPMRPVNSKFTCRRSPSQTPGARSPSTVLAIRCGGPTGGSCSIGSAAWRPTRSGRGTISWWPGSHFAAASPWRVGTRFFTFPDMSAGPTPPTTCTPTVIASSSCGRPRRVVWW